MRLTVPLRQLLVGRRDDFTFRRVESNSTSMRFERPAGLYLHIPFCKHLCPYCPYLRVRLEDEMAADFGSALLEEVRIWGEELHGQDFDSLYVGGGTPTLLLDCVKATTEQLHRWFSIGQSLGVELHPAAMNRQVIHELRSIGFDLASLGVQSFNPTHLRFLGRGYDSQDASAALKLLSQSGFRTVNVDLIFCMPGQTLEDLKADLAQAIRLQADQITCYPLFTFPYSSIGRAKRLTKIRLPDLRQRRRMYYFLHDYLQASGFKRTSVWSFNRHATEPYSSVTRDHYLGLGPSAASYDGSAFYFNTFSVPEYIMTLRAGRLPRALKMSVSPRLEKLYWLYWRLYETRIPAAAYEGRFGAPLKSDFGWLLEPLRRTGFIADDENGDSVLTRRGSHWIHLAQNYFALDYVNRVWSACHDTAWPVEVKI